jgi:hypothetical protein
MHISHPSTIGFYEALPTFNRFSRFVDRDPYHEVPDDWNVVITDVKGSTKAIEQGRYRDVNTVGAATIVVIQNVLGEFQFPYIFGGDGATLLVPTEHLPLVKASLLGLKAMAQSAFQLELRVGAVPMSEVRRCGGIVEVSKFELTKGRSIAFFRGGGLTVAEALIKSKDGKYDVRGKAQEPSMEGLSCRWRPIESRRGSILSLLVMERPGFQESALREVIAFLERVFEGQLDSANPAEGGRMVYKPLIQCVRDEMRYHGSIFSRAVLARFLEVLFCQLVFRFRLPLNPATEVYTKAVPAHSDFRKFDDMLRMILDSSAAQTKQIRAFLEDLRAQGKIYYGLFESSTCLMTCFVENIGQGGHIHFIDGGDGGYAVAAKQLKSQMAADSPVKPPVSG